MAAQLQISMVQNFDPRGDPQTLSQRWERWQKSFTYFITASGIGNDARKKALLLHTMGTETQELFETLPDTGQTYDEAVEALTTYFIPQKNVTFERSVFNNANQQTHETTEQYVSRLCKLAQNCDYGNSLNDHIRDRVVSGCKGSKYREKLLAEKNLTLEKVIEIGQSMEAAKSQSKRIEQSNNKDPPDHVNTLDQQNNRNFRGRGRWNISFPRGGSGPRNRSQAPHPSTRGTNSHRIMCGRCRAMGHKGEECRRSKNSKCNKCGKTGHFQRMCLSNRQQPINRRDINQLEEQPPEDNRRGS
ncbi:uncharacterized protein [Clytia hemisphaerica]|uniref:uncharacterized protein n=1 Tax=Clytia hemisphaerica TaxID=252671 RepID=UPI0034D6AFEF